MKFEWYLTEEELLEGNEATKEEEDYICGSFYAESGKKTYLVDIYHERYTYAERCFDLEVYETTDDGALIGEWLGSIKDIKTATNLKRFKNRAEKLVESFILEEEN